VTVYAYCVCSPLVLCIGVYSVEESDSWLALDKVLVPDIHMNPFRGGHLSEQFGGIAYSYP
jgi:hypothetical protein